MDFLSENSMVLMEKSMGYLWTKQAAILDNISNAETPNYKAKVVTFEDSLNEKLKKAASKKNSNRVKESVRSVLDDSEIYVTEYQEATREDDNGVNITEQTTEMVRNAYQLQYVYQSINNNLSILRKAIEG
jgi:flagellar basal-body rod protein FlgB